MCGIIYAKNLKDNHPVNNLVKILYENQKERGQQGFGFVGLNTKQIDTYRATNEKGIITYLNSYYYDEIIFHHRLPTSTQNTIKSTHPFVIEIEDKIYYFVHNGIIQNADELKEKHEKKGITYSSLALEPFAEPALERSEGLKDKLREGKEGTKFNDGEALAWEFCLWLNNKEEKIKAQGSAAFVCLEVDRGTNQAQRLYFYRNDESPLKIYQDKTLFLIASEGNYAQIKKNWLYFWDYREKHIRRHKFLAIQSPRVFSFNRYDYYSFFDDEILENEFDKKEIKAHIRDLKQERDYLLSVGEYIEAEVLDCEIDDLKNYYI